MKAPLGNLFSPGRINSLKVKNRLVMAAMGTHAVDIQSGRPTPQMIAHYAARARGGVGLVIVEPVLVGDTVPPGVACLRLNDDAAIPGFAELATAIQENGAKAALQLVAPLTIGRRMKTGPIKGEDFQKTDSVYTNVVPPKFGFDAFSALNQKDFNICGDSFVKTAVRAQKAGFDAVEFHACHGSFLCASLSFFSNRRTDEYGGGAERRTRLLGEIISGTRQETGPEFPLIVRLSVCEFIEGGTTLESTLVQAPLIEEAGADALHLTAGSQHRLDWHAPPYQMSPGPLLSYAKKVKQLVGIPIITVGKIREMEMAEQALIEHTADFIGLGRPLLADADFIKKTRAGQFEEIRPCVYCNKCHESTFRNPVFQTLSCAVNPGLLRWEGKAPQLAKPIKRIMVVGGGLAGLEAAGTLAERGYRVTLFEQKDRLGGQWNIASQVISKKDDFPRLIRFLVNRAEKAGVDIKINRAVDLDLIKRECPEKVVIATGATPATVVVPGVDRKNVVQANDIISGKSIAGERVVIVGGGYVGMEVAEFLGRQGKKVSLVDLQAIGQRVGITIYHGLMEKLVKYDVNFYPNSPVYEITENGVFIEYNDELLFLPTDNVILAVGVVPERSLIQQLQELGVEAHAIGDCVTPRDAMVAIRDAAELGRKI